MRGIRFEECKGCGQRWNVSVFAAVPCFGYMCPKCRYERNRLRREAGEFPGAREPAVKK